jgi:hypothetical protein
MAYGTLAQVKSLLQITSDEGTTWDAEVSECILSGDAITDATLTKKGLTPTTPTPQLILDAASNYAAWVFRRKRSPEAAKQFFADAEDLMQRYIDANVRHIGKVVTQHHCRSQPFSEPFNRGF